MSAVYICHAPDCEVTNLIDNTLEDFFYCDIHGGIEEITLKYRFRQNPRKCLKRGWRVEKNYLPYC